MIRTYIFTGQFGIAGTLPALARRLLHFGPTTLHPYNPDINVVTDIRNQTHSVALIGFSLGANATALIANDKNQRIINLIVAYDPSRQSPFVRRAGNGQYVQDLSPSNVQRAICYYNPNTWWYGGARLLGIQVETVFINKWHMAVANDEHLHTLTFNAIEKLA